MRAYERQLQAFWRATADRVKRETITVEYRSKPTAVAVHRYAHPDPSGTLLVTGGVDTWKVELHVLATTLASAVGLDVVAFDMPGTGESTVPLAGDAEEIYRGVIDRVHAADRPLGVMGVSFGGMWAAKLALHGDVDFAVDLGGPVGATERHAQDLAALPNGMTAILAHALHLDGVPTPTRLAELLEQFSLRAELDDATEPGAPLLVVNGTQDQYIPAIDTEILRKYHNATVWHIEGATHCAAEKIRPVIAAIVAWIVAYHTALGEQHHRPARRGRSHLTFARRRGAR